MRAQPAGPGDHNSLCCRAERRAHEGALSRQNHYGDGDVRGVKGCHTAAQPQLTTEC
eukprot:COSAG01_NODE_43412_length_430_cov_0.655589_1_plen_56_part_10